ncbi:MULTISPECIES: histidine phosphatase family protein [Pseudomonas]|uniref:Histidine phosphatase family protein n=1 Tax=Pseudomonas mosselii TaxID=78327 RepID=A0A7W2PYZ7_9PSED|nr:MULTISPECIES: histidine phosphatase family protein [Pseudomonas]MBC7211983.1 histidine phosphatase family protein [Pseudomonas sp.]KXG81915.1 phosphoglycerate mutase [Pseudomonas mosselii]MBA6066051.1 histidine phosphatase family protein [Pseudomonas mosselii]MBC3456288.1 histidine phosphatase family protein [Pseudomonas mosselii]MBH3312302.1 histidine phosphatase family protein [Pseudomonas mosselii]
MGNLYLIRHGQASFGAADYDVLSPVGERQSRALGEHLAQLGVRLDRCLAGTLRRQQDTARLALDALQAHGEAVPTIETDAAFNEFDADGVIRALLPALLPEEPEALHVLRNGAQHRGEFQRLFALMVQRWHDGEHAHDEHLETWQAFTGRVGDGLRRLLDSAASGDNIALFTSGGTIAALLHLVSGITPAQAFTLNWQIINTSLSHLKFRGRDVTLASFNSQAHVRLLRLPELVTYR